MSGLLLAFVIVLLIVIVGLAMSCLILAKLADQISADFDLDDARRLERMKAGRP